MIGWRKRVLLRHYLDEVMSKTDLPAKLGISVRTIYHWIETGQLDRDLAADTVSYGPRPPVPTKLDPFKGIIFSRLDQYPKLTATHRTEPELKPGGAYRIREHSRLELYEISDEEYFSCVDKGKKSFEDFKEKAGEEDAGRLYLKTLENRLDAEHLLSDSLPEGEQARLVGELKP